MKTEMTTFKELFEEYQESLEYANRMLSTSALDLLDKSSDFWEGYKFSIFRKFEMERMNLADGYPSIIFKNSKTDLSGKLFYRGLEIDVFMDDSGQQYYIKYNGKEISGGSFNSNPIDAFVYEIDKDLDGIKIL